MNKSKLLKGIGLGVGAIIVIVLGIFIGKAIGEYVQLTAENTSLEVRVDQSEEANQSLKEELGQVKKECASLKEQIKVYEEKAATEAEAKAAKELEKKKTLEAEAAKKEDLAISLVRAYLEGKGYVPKCMMVDHMENGIYVVHAFDIIELPGEVGHTATVGWYDVNVETMEVISMF